MSKNTLTIRLQRRHPAIESFGCGSIHSTELFRRIAAREEQRQQKAKDLALRRRVLGC